MTYQEWCKEWVKEMRSVEVRNLNKRRSVAIIVVIWIVGTLCLGYFLREQYEQSIQVESPREAVDS